MTPIYWRCYWWDILGLDSCQNSNYRPANLNSLVSVTKNKFVRNKCWSVSNVFGPPRHKLFAHTNLKKSRKINFRFRSFAKPARGSTLFPNVFAAITVRHVTSSRHNACTHSLNFGITANEGSFPHITHKIQMAAITRNSQTRISVSGISAPSAVKF